jgi:hypothetical protein
VRHPVGLSEASGCSSVGRVRRQSEESGGVELTGQAPGAPQVVVEVCRCGCTPEVEEPDWPLAQAWAWLTRLPDGDEDPESEVDPAELPWWDARSSSHRRRAVLPLVLLGELQAGVLLRALWEVAQNGSGPTA